MDSLDDPLSVWLKLRVKLNNTNDRLLNEYQDDIISSLGGMRSILQDYLLNADILQQFDKKKTKSLLNTLYRIQENNNYPRLSEYDDHRYMRDRVAHPHHPHHHHPHLHLHDANTNYSKSTKRYSVDLSELKYNHFNHSKQIKRKDNHRHSQQLNPNHKYINHKTTNHHRSNLLLMYNDKYPVTKDYLTIIELPQDTLSAICTYLTVCDLKCMQLTCSTLTAIARLPASKYIACQHLQTFDEEIKESILCVANNFYKEHELDDTRLTFKLHDIAKLLAREDCDERAFKKYVKKLIKCGVLRKVIRFMSESNALSVQEQCIWIIKKIIKFNESFASKMVARGALDAYLKLFYLNDQIFARKILKGLKKLCEYEWIQKQLLKHKIFKQILYKYYQQISFEGTAATDMVQNSVYIDNCVEIISYLYSNNLYLPEWTMVIPLFPIIVRLILSKRITDCDILRHILSTIAKISHNDKMKNEHIRLLMSYSELLIPHLCQILKKNINDDDICCSVMNIIGNILKYDDKDNKNIIKEGIDCYQEFIEHVLKQGFIQTTKECLTISSNCRVKQETLRVLINLLNNGNQHQIGYLLSHEFLHKCVSDICINDHDTNTIKFGVVYLFTALKLINDKRIMVNNNVVIAFIHLLNIEKHKSNQILFAALRGLNAFYPSSSDDINYIKDKPLLIYISKVIIQSENCIKRLKAIETNTKLNTKTRNLSTQIQKHVSMRVFYH